MAEEQVAEQPAVEEKKLPEPIVDTKNDVIRIPGELLANVWDEKPLSISQDGKIETEEKKPEEKKLEEKAKQEPETDFIDADEYLSKELGYKTWDEAKAAKAELEELKKQPKVEIPKFSTEEREKLFTDAFPVLQAKNQLERAEKLDASDVRQAEQILKLNLQFKYKDLSPDEIDRKFNKQFTIPIKPRQLDTDTAEEYAENIRNWEAQVQDIQKDIVIEAKLAKPELSKFKSELILPDIPKPTYQPAEPTKEELESIEKIRTDYLGSMDPGIKSFTGFTATVKDEAVEIPISYSVTDEERNSLKKDLETFDHIAWIEQRWLTKDGKIDVTKMASDKYFLENQSKVLQKVANDAASKRLEAHIKSKSNIRVDAGNGDVKLNPEKPKELNSREKEIQYLWDNG